MSRQERILAYVAFAIVCVVWGTTYLAIRIAIRTLPTFLFPGLRFTIAGAVLLSFLLLRGEKLPHLKSDWINLLIVGITMVGAGNLAVVWAEHHVNSGFAALLVATAPFWMAILEGMRRNGERLSARRKTGMAIGFVGVALLVGPEIHFDNVNVMFLLGVVALQAGSISWNYGSIRSKYNASKELSPLVSASIQMVIGGMALALIGLARGEASSFRFTTETFAAFVYLILFGSIAAYGAYVFALSKLPTTTTSLYAYINPIVAVILGYLILGEPIGWNAVVGMLVIFSGVALVQTGKKTKDIVAAEAEMPAADAA
jgi:drug/metabolite transporter (DMT)-like permease